MENEYIGLAKYSAKRFVPVARWFTTGRASLASMQLRPVRA
jgi:hypothetical protein